MGKKREKWTPERVNRILIEANLKFIRYIDENAVIKNTTKVEVLCGCGRELFIRAISNINTGQVNCKICTKEIQKSSLLLDFNDVKRDVEVNGFKLISSEYLGGHKKHEFECPDGHRFNMRISAFKSGQRCRACSNSNLSSMYSKGKEQYKIELLEAHKGNIVILGDYTNCQVKTLHLCKVCDNEWLAYPVNMLRGVGCSSCSLSKGEKRVEDYLVNNKIDFINEYEYSDLLSELGFPLRFDFAVVRDGVVVSLIEYDGEFHFSKRYETHDFEKQQLHDKMKNEYCSHNSIELIRIPYTEFDNIEWILSEKLQ